MSDFPNTLVPPLPTITPFSEEAYGPQFRYADPANDATSGTWPVASQAVVCPFTIAIESTAVKMFLMNGATVSGNVDVAIYDSSFKRLVSDGGHPQAGVTSVQVFDIADTVLPPGQYWMAVVLDNTTGTVYRHAPTTAVMLVHALVLAKATAYPLPDPLAPSFIPASTVLPLFGVSFDTLL